MEKLHSLLFCLLKMHILKVLGNKKDILDNNLAECLSSHSPAPVSGSLSTLHGRSEK